MGSRSGIIALLAALIVGGCAGTAAAPAAGKPLTVGCSTAVTTGSLVPGIHPVTAPVAGSPAAVVSTASGRWVFASVSSGGTGAVEVTVSADDRYAFVTDETSGALSVFDLAWALRDGFTAPRVAIGIVPLAYGAVGVAVSPDGSRLYVTTYGGYGPHGLLWAIDAARAEDGAAGQAVLGKAYAGCQPVRVAVSPDGATAWVTTEQSNALLAFATAGLVPGTGGPAAQTVSVISTAAALAGRPAGIGAIPAGRFPRDLSVNPAVNEVYLANFNSGTIEEFPVPATTP